MGHISSRCLLDRLPIHHLLLGLVCTALNPKSVMPRTAGAPSDVRPSHSEFDVGPTSCHAGGGVRAPPCSCLPNGRTARCASGRPAVFQRQRMAGDFTGLPVFDPFAAIAALSQPSGTTHVP